MLSRISSDIPSPPHDRKANEGNIGNPLEEATPGPVSSEEAQALQMPKREWSRVPGANVQAFLERSELKRQLREAQNASPTPSQSSSIDASRPRAATLKSKAGSFKQLLSSSLSSLPSLKSGKEGSKSPSPPSSMDMDAIFKQVDNLGKEVDNLTAHPNEINTYEPKEYFGSSSAFSISTTSPSILSSSPTAQPIVALPVSNSSSEQTRAPSTQPSAAKMRASVRSTEATKKSSPTIPHATPTEPLTFNKAMAFSKRHAAKVSAPKTEATHASPKKPSITSTAGKTQATASNRIARQSVAVKRASVLPPKMPSSGVSRAATLPTSKPTSAPAAPRKPLPKPPTTSGSASTLARPRASTRIAQPPVSKAAPATTSSQQASSLNTRVRAATQSTIQRASNSETGTGYRSATKSSVQRASLEAKKEPALSRSSSVSSLEQKSEVDSKRLSATKSPTRKSVAPLSPASDYSRPLNADQRAALVAKRRAATQSSLTSKASNRKSIAPTRSTPSSAPTSAVAQARSARSEVQKTGSMKNLLQKVNESKQELLEDAKELLQQINPIASKKEMKTPFELVTGWVIQQINQESIIKKKNNSVALLLLKYDNSIIASYEGVLRDLPKFGSTAINQFKEILEREPELNTKKLELQMLVVEKNNSGPSGKSARVYEYGSYHVKPGPIRWYLPMTPKEATNTIIKSYLSKTKFDESDRFLNLIQLLFSTTPHTA